MKPKTDLTREIGNDTKYRQYIGYLTLWRPVLPYGYSYTASCARPG